MTSIYRLGIDLAKDSFELCGVDERQSILLRKTIKRNKLLEFIATLPQTTICMEACGGANHWARGFAAFGHEVRLIPAQYVKPFVKSQKNDRNDALAIVEASFRPEMAMVSVKTLEQQDIQSLHRVRGRVLGALNELRNQIRGLLLEYGIAIPVGISQLRQRLPLLLDPESTELTPRMREILFEMQQELLRLEEQKVRYDVIIDKIAGSQEVCKRLTTVPGVGPLTSTLFYAHIGDARHYRNGRQAAANLGLVPRQHSTGGRNVLLGITKRGDRQLRSLLVHGARAVVMHAARTSEIKANQRQKKIKQMLERKHYNKVVVAVANANARVLLSLIKSGQTYQEAA